MFNKEIKEEFIQSAAQTNSNIVEYMERVFDRAEETEILIKKDMRDWNTADIITFYKMQFYTSYSTLKVLNTMLSNYTEWCLRHNLVADSQNHYDELSVKTLMSCVNTALAKTGIFTRKQLLANIEGFFNVSDKFLVLGLFEGLMGTGMSDFWNITSEDIDGNKLNLKGSGRVLEVSDELIHFAYNSIDEFDYHPFVNTESDSTPKDKSFAVDDPRVIKAMWNTSVENDAILRRRMMNRLARLTRSDEQPYRRGLLMESGRIDAIKHYMKQDECNDIRTVYKKHKDELEYRYNTVYDLGSWILQYSSHFEQA